MKVENPKATNKNSERRQKVRRDIAQSHAQIKELTATEILLTGGGDKLAGIGCVPCFGINKKN